MNQTTARKYLDPLFEIEDKLLDLIVGVAADYADSGSGLKLTANLLKAKKFLGKATTRLSKEEEGEEEFIRTYLEAKKRAKNLQNEPTAAAERAQLQDTAPDLKVNHTPVTAPAPAPEKEVTPAPTADGEKDEKKAAPIATPPASKPAEQTAPKAKGWVEKPKSDDKLNSASQENYADKSDADLDKERRLLCRDAVLKGNQPGAVRDFTSEKFDVRTVGAIPREKHGEWVRAFKETFGV